MARRNIYVAEGREGLYEEAALLAGSLSGAIERGLELFVERQRPSAQGMAEVTVTVGSGTAARRKRFVGRELVDAPLPQATAGRVDGVTVYATARGRLAAWVWSDPDFGALRRHEVPEEPGLDWSQRRGHDLLVLDDVAELAEALELDDEVLADVQRAFTSTPLEILDI